MLWQDIVISLANVLFLYSLFKQSYHGFKKKRGFITLQTSSLTTVGLIGMSIAMFSMKLYISGFVLALSAVMWFVLLIQRVAYGEA